MMVRTAEEKHLLERLANGDFDGPVGDDFVTGSYRKVYHWKSIIEGVPVLIREGESTRFFNGKENETISGKRTEERFETDEQKLVFLQRFGWLIHDREAQAYSAKFKPKKEEG